VTKGKLRIAIVGGGLGGLAAAALMQRAGFQFKVYEQAHAFSRLGAGINLGPNLMRVLRRIGIAEELVDVGAQPDRWLSLKWDTGEILLDFPLKGVAGARWGEPYLAVHRGDFHALLLSAVDSSRIEFGKRLVDLDPSGDAVKLGFEDGTKAEADIVIGADGVRSRVREVLIGLEKPKYSGYVAHRCIMPVSLLGDMKIIEYVKWWGEDRIFLPYYITRSRQELFFVSSSPEPEWPHETSSVPGDLDGLRASFAGFHPYVQRILDACPGATKWVQYDCEPLTLWSRGRIVLLGDACHPMMPYMGQGAAMAIEDAAMLTRCLEASPKDIEYAFKLYESSRKARTALVQATSRLNTWLLDEKNTWREGQANPNSVFGYDVFTEPLTPPTTSARASGARAAP
jgi:6-hydroxynicotinate 3-monooxygenase